MLQKRGWFTSMNAVLWLLNFSNSLPKGAVTLSNSKGGFRGGPKGAFVPWNYFVFIYFYRILRTIKRFYIAGWWASVPATLCWIFWIHPLQIQFMRDFSIFDNLFMRPKTNSSIQQIIQNVHVCIACHYQNGINYAKDSS